MICELVKYKDIPAILIAKDVYDQISKITYFCPISNEWVKGLLVANEDITHEQHVSNIRHAFRSH